MKTIRITALIALCVGLAACDPEPRAASPVQIGMMHQPNLGYCNPELIACGYEQPRCQSIAPSQRAAKGCE